MAKSQMQSYNSYTHTQQLAKFAVTRFL